MKQPLSGSFFRRPLRYVGGLLTLAMVVGFGLTSASASTNGALTRSAWRLDIAHVSVPKKGCFTSSYPTLAWRAAKCHTAPARPLAPHVGASRGGPETIGDGVDYSAEITSGTISTATGTFPYISPGSTEEGQINDTGPQYANTYTLELNTEFFEGSPACDAAKSASECEAWEQFVYESDIKQIYMQYWLIFYDKTCPSSWYTYQYSSGGTTYTDCYKNSAAGNLTSNPPVSALPTVSFTGTATSGGQDSVAMSYDGSNASAVGADDVVDLAGRWTVAEFGIFGDAGGGQANFSSKTTLEVKTSINHGAPTAPTCDENGYTGETNNLSFSTAPTVSGSQPAIETQQTSSGTADDCAVAGTDRVAITNPGKQTSTVNTLVGIRLQGSDKAVGPTLTWSASGLPSGLSISSGGVITGKPTKVGTKTVTAKDSTGATATSTFSWVVKNKVSVTNPGKRTSTVGAKVSLQLKGTDSAKGQTLKWSAKGLPAGLSISSAGKVTGKPKKKGRSTVTVTAKDTTGAVGTARFTWVVKA